MSVLIPVFITLWLCVLLWRARNRLASQVVEGDMSFGRAADRLAIHFLLTVCLLQTAWFLWFVIAYNI